MVDLGPVLREPYPVCLHKTGTFEDVTMVCDQSRVYIHVSNKCWGVRREAHDLLRRTAR